jgi:glycosyltransferase involved in cell wall biosynthesis
MGGLLVYIPTYNRPEHLRFQLEALRDQVVGNPRVRLVVADNASPSEDSLQVFASFSAQKWLSFERRPSNIQGNANILQGFLHLRRDEYLWILADDTPVMEGAIDRILDLIDSTSPDLIGLSVENQNHQPRVLDWSPRSFEMVVSKFSWGLISSAIYSGRYFVDFAYEAFFFHNSSFPHLGVLFSALRSRKTISVSWIPTSSIHGENSVDGPSDYSLAVVGFPQLMYLIDAKDRKRLVNNWLKSYSAGFAHYAKRQPLAASSSIVLLRSAGVKARFRLMLGQLEAWFRSTTLGMAIQRIILRTPWMLNALKTSKRLMFKV